MKKLVFNIAEYIFFTLITFLLLVTLAITSSFLWLSDHKEKKLPNNVMQTLAKFYNTQFIRVQMNNATIVLNKDNSLELNGDVLIKHKNSNKVIAETPSGNIKFYPKKIKNLKIPYNLQIKKLDLTIQNTDLQDEALSALLKKYILDNSITLFQIENLAVYDSLLTLGSKKYTLNQTFNLQNFPNKIIIPSINKTQQDIYIEWQPQPKSNKSYDNLYIKNIPLNAITTFLPNAYRPPIFNKASTLMTLNLFKDKNKTKININNNTTDTLINHFSIKVEQSSKSLFDINFDINLKNKLGQFKGNTHILFKQHWFFKPELKLFLNTELENLNLSNLKELWPEPVETQTRIWLISSIIKGSLNKASLKLNIQDINNIKKDNLDAYLTFHDLTLNYYDAHKPITNTSGNVHFDLERVKININSAKVGNADIDNSSVTINFLAPEIPLTINAQSNGQLKNFVHLFHYNNNGSTLEHRGVNVKNTNGLTSFRCKIIIPLAHDLSIDNTYIHVQGKIENADLKIKNNIEIKSPLLNFHIQNHIVSVAGEIYINGQKSSLTLINHLINKGHFDTQIAINAIIKPDSGLLKLLQNKVTMNNGEILSNFLYINKDNTEKIHLQLNMDNSNFMIPDIGLKKPQNNDAKFNMEIESLNQSKWKSKNLSLISKASNINIKSDIEISNDFNEIISLDSDVNIPNSNLNVTFNRTNTKSSYSIISTALDLEHTDLFGILNALTKNKQTKTKETSISLQLDNIKMNNGIYFKNILGNFDCKKSICSNSGLSMSMNNNTKLTIKLMNKNGKNFWLIKSNNAAYLLKGLNIYKNIEGGELTIKVSNITSKQNKPSFSGSFKMTNFSAIKTPLLAKLIILSAFSSLIKTIEGEHLLPFKNMEGNFIIQNHSIRIEQAFATGKFLTATMKGNVNYKNDTLNLYGKMIPKSLVNSIFNQQKEQEQGKAVLSTKYRIVGTLAEPEVRVHPLGALLSILIRIPLGIL